jgi:hypothetical protein
VSTIHVPASTGVSEEDARSAALFLLGNARDAEDGRNLLEACGLMPYEPGEPAKPRAEKSPVIHRPVRGQ